MKETYTVVFTKRDSERKMSWKTMVWHGSNYQSALETLNMKLDKNHRLYDYKRHLEVGRTLV